MLQTNFEMVNNVAKITLVGKLDTVTTPQFQSEVERAIAQQAKRLALIINDLEYIASSGLRVLVYYKQKMGPKVDIYVIGAKAPIRDIFKMTGFHHALILRDAYEAKEIESV